MDKKIMQAEEALKIATVNQGVVISNGTRYYPEHVALSAISVWAKNYMESEKTEGVKPNKLPFVGNSSLRNNERGLYGKYHIQKITNSGLIPVDKEAEYFVLRLDISDGNDIEHVKACRIGIHAYANAIWTHLPKLAEELVKLYPLI